MIIPINFGAKISLQTYEYYCMIKITQ